MEEMRRHVRENDVQKWARDFLRALEYISRANRRALETHRSRPR
jgi:trehalose-6-phosphate synthase